MNFVIVTGMSGAGKTTALKVLEDVGYFCVDNIPLPLFVKFAEFASGEEHGEYDKIALGLDIRSGKTIEDLEPVFDQMKKIGMEYKILFLESSKEVLVKRYKETRRSHPLAGDGRIENGIELERKKIAFLKEMADYIIDTSCLLTKELRSQLTDIFVSDKKFMNFYITVLSFGFKFGIPADADLVFDVRFLPNPYYVNGMRERTGIDKDIADFVLDNDIAVEFMDHLSEMIKFLIPNYIAEGKNRLVIAIGCTGGKHRSVAVARKLAENIMGNGYGVKVEHRDMERNK